MPFLKLDEQAEDTVKAPVFLGYRIVFTSTTILAVSSIIVFVAAVSICLMNDMTSGISACQGLLVFSALLTFPYFALYLLAARKNDDIGKQRPPTRRLHAIIFILLRVGILLWGLGVVASAIVVSKLNTYKKNALVVNLQKLEIAISLVNFLASITILYCLETSSYPFKTPECLPVQPRAVCRASTFEDDIISRSVSHSGSFDDSEQEKCQQDLRAVLEISGQQQKSIVEPSGSPLQMPGAFPQAVLSRSCSDSSSGWTSISSSTVSSDSGRRITPSSSISNISRRSPLSTMRYVDYPDILIRPDLRYIPPQYPSAYDLNIPLLRRPAPLTGPSHWDLTAPVLPASVLPLPPLPVEIPRRTQYHSPPTVPLLHVRRGRSYESLRLCSSEAVINIGSAPPPPPKPKSIRIMRRKTVDVKVPGAWEDPYAEQVEQHSQKIFAEIASEQRQTGNHRGVRSLKQKISGVQLQKKASWDV